MVGVSSLSKSTGHIKVSKKKGAAVSRAVQSNTALRRAHHTLHLPASTRRLANSKWHQQLRPHLSIPSHNAHHAALTTTHVHPTEPPSSSSSWQSGSSPSRSCSGTTCASRAPCIPDRVAFSQAWFIRRRCRGGRGGRHGGARIDLRVMWGQSCHGMKRGMMRRRRM